MLPDFIITVGGIIKEDELWTAASAVAGILSQCYNRCSLVQAVGTEGRDSWIQVTSEASAPELERFFKAAFHRETRVELFQPFALK